jgi:methionine-rich copper-binding protein CopC
MVLLVGVVGKVSAHAKLLRSSPAADERLAHSPQQIILWFDDELDTHASEFQILNAGQPVNARAGHVDLTDPDHARMIAENLPTLSEGVYTVRWKAVSLDDAYTAEGEFDFSVVNAQARVKPQPTPTAVLAEPTAVSVAVAAGLALLLALLSVLWAGRR